ncbi:RNA polymerase factor sigma-70 [Clostridium sp. C105KSO15]|nr:RNA polymerase factor sigma-70 [Clostridium sp. C105KSO15]
MKDKLKQQILEEYASNGMTKLRKVAYPLFIKFGGISEKDHDDFYSKANMELWKATEIFDDSKGVPFEAYLLSCLKRKFMTEMTGLNREKRKADRLASSLDIPIGEDDGMTLGDTLASDYSVENVVLNKVCTLKDENTQNYLNSLSPKQRQIAELIMNEYEPCEIRERLGLTERQYNDYLKDMRTFEKTMVLKQADYVKFEEDKPMSENTQNTQTLEKSKSDRLSIASIIKKIDNRTIRFDHPLQRESEQWSPAMKGNLISDILQVNPIPALVFAEQIVNGLAMIWDLDGKQRCTNAYTFVKGGYKISKNIRRWNIIYQAQLKEDGKPVLDNYGFPMSEKREFDIRGKRFTDLPEELQDKFNEYNFEIVQYLNCSGEDIAYNIARYNEGKPMSASQKGITRLGEEFASMVKSISGMPFFKDMGGYKVSESSNGTINRVVVESVMAANFLEDWKKRQEDMCEYIKDNATVECFDNFEDMVNRISQTGTEDVLNMFDSKDSFIYFGLFARFVNSGLDDEKFIEFMTAFSQSLHSTEINGITFDELNGKSTKDKNVVINKIKHLEQLMNCYLHIEA